jgi:hypothetical protein
LIVCVGKMCGTCAAGGDRLRASCQRSCVKFGATRSKNAVRHSSSRTLHSARCLR